MQKLALSRLRLSRLSVMAHLSQKLFGSKPESPTHNSIIMFSKGIIMPVIGQQNYIFVSSARCLDHLTHVHRASTAAAATKKLSSHEECAAYPIVVRKDDDWPLQPLRKRAHFQLSSPRRRLPHGIHVGIVVALQFREGPVLLRRRGEGVGAQRSDAQVGPVPQPHTHPDGPVQTVPVGAHLPDRQPPPRKIVSGPEAIHLDVAFGAPLQGHRFGREFVLAGTLGVALVLALLEIFRTFPRRLVYFVCGVAVRRPSDFHGGGGGGLNGNLLFYRKINLFGSIGEANLVELQFLDMPHFYYCTLLFVI
mmetsp:Transcript_12542/g.25021  ORF Transcript_12542/g.25021 Transcript_12542/m.25021 type:complete len:307 (-) Transcript_12542:315-1235(-)